MSSLAAVLLDEIDDETLGVLADRLAPLLTAHLNAREGVSPWLNAEDAACYLACSRDRLYDLVQLRKLAPSRDGRRLLFRRVDLDAYLEGWCFSG
jgi:excisionase family DNA binding protein